MTRAFVPILTIENYMKSHTITNISRGVIMQESIFKEFISSDVYGILGIISLCVFIGAGILIAWMVASESRYEKECRKTEEAYERYVTSQKVDSK